MMAPQKQGSENTPPKRKYTKRVKKNLLTEGVEPSVEQTNTLTPALSTDAVEKALIKDVITLAQLEYFKHMKTKIHNEKSKEITSLDAVLKEFVGPYMLIAYDLNDQPIEIISTSNPAEHDALTERFRKMIVRMNQSMMGGDESNGKFF